MSNRYLEKVALTVIEAGLLGSVGGYIGGRPGDRIGSTVSGVPGAIVGGLAGHGLFRNRALGAVAGGLVGGVLGGKAYSRVKDHFVDRENDPGKLEKAAANAYKNFLAGKGMDVAGISSGSLLATAPKSVSAGTFGQFNQTANKIGLQANPRLEVPKGPLGFGIIGSGIKAPIRKRLDAIKANGGTLQGALQQGVAAKKAGSGLLGKALSFAKKKPLFAAGAALATGLAGATMLSNRNNSNQPMYGGYPQY